MMIKFSYYMLLYIQYSEYYLFRINNMLNANNNVIFSEKSDYDKQMYFLALLLFKKKMLVKN